MVDDEHLRTVVEDYGSWQLEVWTYHFGAEYFTVILGGALHGHLIISDNAAMAFLKHQVAIELARWGASHLSN